jgi:hypothetical protein
VVITGITSIEVVVSLVGVHTTDPPGKLGVAVKVAVSPIQIAGLLIVKVGRGLTVTVALAGVLEHPLTVYVSE